MTAGPAPDARRASVTMYDPARDAYTESKTTTTAEHGAERKVQGQEHQGDAVGAAVGQGPGQERAPPPGSVGRGVSELPASAIVSSYLVIARPPVWIVFFSFPILRCSEGALRF
jgi:hypothetical protein